MAMDAEVYPFLAHPERLQPGAVFAAWTCCLFSGFETDKIYYFFQEGKNQWKRQGMDSQSVCWL
jgi:hypothetical protein